MKIAVTGASGFIGRHVMSELARRSIEAVAVSRSASRLLSLLAAVQIAEIDIETCGADCFERIGRPDVLIHLAWDGLPNYRSLHHFESELPRQYRFLRAMVDAGVGSLLVAGTCLEYGPQSGPLSEDLATRPVTPYAHAKDALRQQLEFLRANRGFNLTWARLFYTYGEGQAATSLYSAIRDAVARGERVFPMTSGEQLRDYLPVTEVARLLVTLATRSRHIGVVNVCSGVPISVRKLVDGWIADHGWRIDLGLGQYPYPDYEPMAFWGNRQRLDQVLGGT